jgi:polysaccharide biosynthesis transport protein
MTETDRTTHDRSLVLVHAWVIVVVTVIFVGAATAFVTSQPREYQAEAEVELFALPTRGAPIPPNLATERRVALSGSVARDAAERLDAGIGAARAGISVSAVADADVLVLTYTAGSPGRAVRGVEAFTQSYVAARNERSRVRSVEVITQPELLPTKTPVSSSLILVAGLLLGVAVGTAGAFAWDRLSGRVRTSGELVRAGARVLVTGLMPPRGGRIRPHDLRNGRNGYFTATLGAVTGHRREGVRILVTSPRPDVERAGTAALAAAALATTGRQVVLVDADTNHGEVDGLASGPSAHGFGDLVAGRCSPEAATRPTPIDGLTVIGSDRSLTADGDVDVDGLTVALGQLASRQIVVVVGPPLLTSARAWQLVDQADAILVVAEIPRLRRVDAAQVVEMLGSVADAAVGWVLLPGRARRRLNLRGRRKEPTVGRPGARTVRSEVGGRVGS